MPPIASDFARAVTLGRAARRRRRPSRNHPAARPLLVLLPGATAIEHPQPARSVERSVHYERAGSAPPMRWPPRLSLDAPRLRLARLASVWRSERAPLELQLLGRTVWHAALVGAAAGLVGALLLRRARVHAEVVLEEAAGYVVLRASGETFAAGAEAHHVFRPWLLLFIPAVGALLGGLVSRFAPETRGGGGDEMIRAFHHAGGVVRRRVLWVKMAASIFTLGSGGSGGREGPTMQIGAAIGSTLGRWLGVSTRERRVLMVAGVAAGMSAVFRTPLGAALLAVEVLYRDDFESDALIPAVLASVIAYSIVISMYGESTLFARAPHYPFIAAHLPLYALVAIAVALLRRRPLPVLLHRVEHLAQRLPVPAWLRPAVGGLALGIVAMPTHHCSSARASAFPGKGSASSAAGTARRRWPSSAARGCRAGWSGVELLLILCAAKMLASGAHHRLGRLGRRLRAVAGAGRACSAAPSAARRSWSCTIRASIPAPSRSSAWAHSTAASRTCRLASLVFVSELAGSYDLLVPLMLAEGIAFVALRNRSLYRAQVPTKEDSPVHRVDRPARVSALRVSDVVDRGRPHRSFRLATPAAEIAATIADGTEPRRVRRPRRGGALLGPHRRRRAALLDRRGARRAAFSSPPTSCSRRCR